MPPQKKRKTSSKTKAPGKSAAVQNSSGGNAPFYVLVIIILITIIVLLLNKFYEKGQFTIPKIFKDTAKTETLKDKPDPSKDKLPDTKARDEKKAPEEKTDKDKPEDKKSDDKPVPAEKEVSVYFLKLNEKTEKIYLSPVKRKVPDSQLIYQALEQLIKGPTKNEEARGFITAVPARLKIRGIDIKGKTAEIDFNGVIEEGAAGDILLKRLEQIIHTATQFDSVDSIIIKINGQKRKSIGSDGYSISGPLRK
jgi:spore germination protein GerM